MDGAEDDTGQVWVHARAHTHTDTAVGAHLLLWQSEVIPPWSRRPCDYFSLWFVCFFCLAASLFSS